MVKFCYRLYPDVIYLSWNENISSCEVSVYSWWLFRYLSVVWQCPARCPRCSEFQTSDGQVGAIFRKLKITINIVPTFFTCGIAFALIYPILFKNLRLASNVRVVGLLSLSKGRCVWKLNSLLGSRQQIRKPSGKRLPFMVDHKMVTARQFELIKVRNQKSKSLGWMSKLLRWLCQNTWQMILFRRLPVHR